MNNSVFHSTYESPIGTLHIVSDDEGLLRVYTKSVDIPFSSNEHNIKCIDLLSHYFAGESVDFSVLQISSRLSESTFTRKVRMALQTIPYGTAVTYKDIAERIGLNKGYQAVGGAIGRNPLLIVVPCHRVIGSDGRLTGFSAGIDVKRYLLNLEKISYK